MTTNYRATLSGGRQPPLTPLSNENAPKRQYIVIPTVIRANSTSADRMDPMRVMKELLQNAIVASEAQLAVSALVWTRGWSADATLCSLYVQQRLAVQIRLLVEERVFSIEVRNFGVCIAPEAFAISTTNVVQTDLSGYDEGLKTSISYMTRIATFTFSAYAYHPTGWYYPNSTNPCNWRKFVLQAVKASGGTFPMKIQDYTSKYMRAHLNGANFTYGDVPCTLIRFEKPLDSRDEAMALRDHWRSAGCHSHAVMSPTKTPHEAIVRIPISDAPSAVCRVYLYPGVLICCHQFARASRIRDIVLTQAEIDELNAMCYAPPPNAQRALNPSMCLRSNRERYFQYTQSVSILVGRVLLREAIAQPRVSEALLEPVLADLLQPGSTVSELTQALADAAHFDDSQDELLDQWLNAENVFGERTLVRSETEFVYATKLAWHQPTRIQSLHSITELLEFRTCSDLFKKQGDTQALEVYVCRGFLAEFFTELVERHAFGFFCNKTQQEAALPGGNASIVFSLEMCAQLDCEEFDERWWDPVEALIPRSVFLAAVTATLRRDTGRKRKLAEIEQDAAILERECKEMRAENETLRAEVNKAMATARNTLDMCDKRLLQIRALCD